MQEDYIDFDALTEHLYGDGYDPEIARKLQNKFSRIGRFHEAFRQAVGGLREDDSLNEASPRHEP